MPPRQTKPKEEDVEAKEERSQTDKEVAAEWAEKKLIEKPKALDESLVGIKTVAVKNLDDALLAIDAAYLLISPTSFNNKDTYLTVLTDVREDLAEAVVALGGLG